ncbi:hypothetical protein RHMOL_Rhmol13G0108000 [Rhododendron molle]|uniref:Uncharacterized protein n=1 Tax=Rhododendron molle TaxID=49168 RepID=A0ACC0L6B6_RHOML|nr:hypothetical protein RHMOL_Rhmol13G0108000 [Rhododendron molle]
MELFHVIIGSLSAGFQHTDKLPSTGTSQGLHDIHGSFSVPNMADTLASRVTTMTHRSSHVHSGVTSRLGMNVVGTPEYSSSTSGLGGSLPGILSTSTAIGNRSAGDAGPWITSTVGNMVGSGNVGRSMSPGGGLSVPGLASRLNLTANIGSENLRLQSLSRLSGVLQQAPPHVISMRENSYANVGAPLSQSHFQAMNNLRSMGTLNDVNSNDGSPFDINDFPQLTNHPSSSGGSRGPLGLPLKQGLGVGPFVQQNQEFSIQNEDFPALPGYKGGNDYVMDLHQEEQFHDNAMSMMGRSSGFNLGGIFTSHRPRQQQQRHPPSVSSSGVSFSGVNQDHLHGSDMFQSAHSGYRPQVCSDDALIRLLEIKVTSSPLGIGLRPLNSPNIDSGMVSHDQLIQQYQQHSNQNQFRLQQISSQNQSYKDQGVKSMQAAPDPFCLLGLLSVIRMTDPHWTSLALGIDLTTLGLNLNSTENLHKTFGSPWFDKPAQGDPEVTVPQCYYAKEMPPLHQSYFLKFPMDTLFYIFHSMPKDEAQIYAANELCNRGWFYHRELHLWLTRVSNMEPLVKTNTYERGSYICFDPNTWEMLRKVWILSTLIEPRLINFPPNDLIVFC